jgi:uncharacterized membrane protein HdeD (DUF308 family)
MFKDKNRLVKSRIIVYILGLVDLSFFYTIFFYGQNPKLSTLTLLIILLISIFGRLVLLVSDRENRRPAWYHIAYSVLVVMLAITAFVNPTLAASIVAFIWDGIWQFSTWGLVLFYAIVMAVIVTMAIIAIKDGRKGSKTKKK